MQGSSRAASKASHEALAQALESGGEQQLAEDLLGVSDLISGHVVLLRALTDPSRDGSDRVGLAAKLLEGKVSPAAQHVVQTMVNQRWASERDLADTLEDLGVSALLAGARAQGNLDRVQDELFRFDRIVAGTPQLREALTDRLAPAQAKGELTTRLLDGKVAPETARLVRHAVTHGRRRRYDQSIERYLQLADQRQEQVTANVTSAVTLTPEQVQRLTGALTSMYGRTVNVNLVLDPRVVGGVRIEIGGEVIDGTVLSRLEDARRRMTG